MKVEVKAPLRTTVTKILDCNVSKKVIIFLSDTFKLDEQGRERHHGDKTRYNPKHCRIERSFTTAHGQYTKSNDDDREQARRSYRKKVSTTWLNLKKPLTENHQTSKLEKAVDHFEINSGKNKATRNDGTFDQFLRVPE